MAIDQPPPAVETIVVQAARLPPSIGDAAFSIVRLSPEQLASTPRVDEALADVPGVSLFRRTSSLAANPTTQGISLREIAGSGAGRALVTLDGVPQNDPFGGWVIWTGLPSETIETASVVRGAGAGPYGAGALTGVIALEEQAGRPGSVMADVSGGNLGYRRAGAAADVGVGPASLLMFGSIEHSDGWTPVRDRRGPADDNLSLDDWSVGARLQASLGPAVMAARVSAFREKREAGLLGAHSRAKGQAASLTFAAQPTPDQLGWRVQAWVRKSDLVNTSVAVAADRKTTTPANEQYEAPATGWGVNAAVRSGGPRLQLEAGFDVRGTDGEEHEHFTFTAGRFVNDRRAGGQTLVYGGYLEGAWNLNPWLITGGIRLDRWSNFNAMRVQRTIATGALTLDQRTPDASGTLPTGRIGVRREFYDGRFYIRSAAYAGFRPATLNELHRPFRVGNDVTEANPSLVPEKLYGIEGGFGGREGRLSWNATVFYNQLKDAVANVTIGIGPGTFPIAGVIPAGGVLRQRQNTGAVNAVGFELDGRFRVSEQFSLKTALAFTQAAVDGGRTAPQLTGLQPAQTPRFTLTAGAEWRPVERLTLSADLRYEESRFDDDLNTRVLSAGTTVDLRAEYRFGRGVSAYLAADNIANSDLETGQTADGVESFGPPRMVRIGLRFKR